MNDKVRMFIEENIEAIEKQDWYTVFYSWYLHSGSEDKSVDDKNITELFQVLDKIFINTRSASLKDRISVLKGAMEDYIYARVNSDAEKITCLEVQRQLNSYLGLRSTSTISVIFREAAKECGFPIKVPNRVIYLK